MPTPKLSPHKKAAILAEKAKGLTNKEVAEKLRVGVGTVHNVISEAQREAEVQTPQDAHERFQDLREQYRAIIGWNGKAAPPPPKPKAQEIKIVVINDLHVPAHDREALAHIIKTHAMNTHRLIVAGDLMDNWNVSKYPKSKRPWSPTQELREVQACLLTLAEAFPEVIVQEGNHDARLMKLFQRRGIEPEIIEYLEFTAPNVLSSPMRRLTEGLANVEVVEPLRHDYAEYPHIMQHGDLILSHSERFSKICNKATHDVIHWLKSYLEPMGLIQPFKVVGHAHTHQSGTTYDDYGILGIELGCLAKTPDYAGSPRLMGAPRPTVVGYSVFYQTNDKTDITKSGFVPLRWGTERYF